jgi:hypothetical protein
MDQSLTSQNSNDKKKDSAISVQDEHDCLCAAFSSLRNLFHRIGINPTVMGTRDVYCNSGNNQLMTPISSHQMKNNIICYVRPISEDKCLNDVPGTTSILVIFYFLSHSATLSK